MNPETLRVLDLLVSFLEQLRALDEAQLGLLMTYLSQQGTTVRSSGGNEALSAQYNLYALVCHMELIDRDLQW